MPIYEYKCQDCQKIFEKLTFKEEEIECPFCGSKNVIKLISIFSSIGINGRNSNCSTCSSKNCSSCG
jgi:putative FmdB family regulatory protein